MDKKIVVNRQNKTIEVFDADQFVRINDGDLLIEGTFSSSMILEELMIIEGEMILESPQINRLVRIELNRLDYLVIKPRKANV